MIPYSHDAARGRNALKYTVSMVFEPKPANEPQPQLEVVPAGEPAAPLMPVRKALVVQATPEPADDRT